MNELNMTLVGWVATDPTQRVGPSGVRVTTFRVASTSRYFDRQAGTWKDARTEWATVNVYRAAAIYVAESLKKGQPVVVTGRFRTSEWTTEGGDQRVSLVIDATSVGHDLTRGTAVFTRAIVDGDMAGDGDAPYRIEDDGDQAA